MRSIVRWSIPFTVTMALCGAVIVPPVSLLKPMMWLGSGWLLTNYMNARGPSAHVVAVAKKTCASYLQWLISAQLADEARVTSIRDDTDAVAAAASLLRRRVLTGAQLPHAPRDWPALVGGYGYCDQINGAACEILARRFSKAETVSLIDSRTHQSPHTVGRVWSNQLNDWIYFDAYLDPAVIYRKTGDRVVFLRIIPHRSPLPSRGSAPDGLYALNGKPLAQYHGTFAGYMAGKLASKRFESLIAAHAPPAPVLEEARSGVVTAGVVGSPQSAPPRDDEAFGAVSRAYMLARADALLGRGPGEYRRLAGDPRTQRDWRARELAIAARTFLMLQRR